MTATNSSALVRWLISIASASVAIAGCTTGGPVIPGIDGGPDAGHVVTPDAGPDGGPLLCPPGEIDCAGVCTRVAGDALNCGSCGNACPTGVGCAAGRCVCEAPRVSCDAVCRDLASDPEHCGACGHACGPLEMCSGGTCIVVCTEPERLCVNRDESGAPLQVCADLQTDPINCGACNTRCTGGSLCTDGRCQCPTDQLNCGGTCVPILTDVANCGSCRVSCGADGTCEDGRCTVCGTGLTECTGRCLDVTTDRFNCGSCGRACGSGEACVGGLCECMGSLVDCGTGCLDLMTDSANCGGCGVDCGPGGTCSGGTCTCSGTLTLCTAGCRDLDTDPANCGACDAACTVGGSICSAGTCACPTGMTECGGTCRNLASDPAHCGACDSACPGMQVCVASACIDVPPPANDTCTGAAALSASGTRTTDTLLGASQQSAGDCGGAEVYYSITITERSVLYLDTFGTSFDTRIAYRGTSCTGAATSCADDACTVTQSQLAVVASAGTHFFSVHAGPAAIPGPFSLRWQVVPAAGGTNTQITAPGTFTGTTSGSGARTATCTTADGPEDGYWFTVCPGVTRTVGATTCGTSLDTVVHARTGSGEIACNDDSDCGGFIDLQSTISFTAVGPGVWEIYADGFDPFEAGPYTISVTGL